jgi:hypothetical protein
MERNREMILIDSHELMTAGDEFRMLYGEWDRIIRPPMGPYAHTESGRKIRCQVLRVFVRSSREVRYTCVSLNDPRRAEFVLGQVLESAYQVSLKHPTLTPSAAIVIEAAAKSGVRSITPEMPTLYTREDAEKLAAAVQGVELTERYGYLVPSVESWRRV